MACVFQAFAQIEQGGCSDTAANEEHTLSLALWQRESATEWQHAVEPIASFEHSHFLGAVANGMHQEPNLVFFWDDKVDTDRATQECGGGIVDTNFHKLPWEHLRQLVTISGEL